MSDHDEDVVYKVARMRGAICSLRRYADVTPQGDLMPGYDAASAWPLIVSVNFLLEQCLKVLVAHRTAEGMSYLARRAKPQQPPAQKGGPSHSRKYWQSPAEKDGHELRKVFDRLDDEAKAHLSRRYKELSSLLGVTQDAQQDARSAPDALDAYLGIAGDHALALDWRYLFSESMGRSALRLPPCSFDLELEVAQACVDLLSHGDSEQWMRSDDGAIRSISMLLSQSVSCLVFPDEGMAIEDYWRMSKARGSSRPIDMFAKHIRVGRLAPESDVWAKMLDKRLKHVREQARSWADKQMLIFLQQAERSVVEIKDGAFRFRNRRPDPLPANDPRLCPDGLDLSWRNSAGEWSGAVDALGVEGRPKDWGLPVRPGQTFQARWFEHQGPLTAEFVPSKFGELRIGRGGREWLRMRAWLLMRWSSSDDGDERMETAKFVRMSETDDAVPVVIDDFMCQRCRGTGFCPSCLGESADASECSLCAATVGLCPECKGYGADGHWLLVQAPTPAADVRTSIDKDPGDSPAE